MTALEFPSNANAKVRFDPEFLLRQLPALSDIKRKRRDWNELGEKIAREFPLRPVRLRRTPNHTGPADSPGDENWMQAKALLCNVMASLDPSHASVRKRLGDLQNPSTAALYSTLSLWLAGKLGISLTVTQPMVAVMLYAVHEASGSWEVLRDR